MVIPESVKVEQKLIPIVLESCFFSLEEISLRDTFYLHSNFTYNFKKWYKFKGFVCFVHASDCERDSSIIEQELLKPGKPKCCQQQLASPVGEDVWMGVWTRFIQQLM